MPLIFWVSSAALVAIFAVLAARTLTGRGIARSPIQAVSTALVVGLLAGWPAVQWLQAGHPEATTVRYAAVWVQALSAFGTAAILLLGAWPRKAAVSRPAR